MKKNKTGQSIYLRVDEEAFVKSSAELARMHKSVWVTYVIQRLMSGDIAWFRDFIKKRKETNRQG